MHYMAILEETDAFFLWHVVLDLVSVWDVVMSDVDENLNGLIIKYTSRSIVDVYVKMFGTPYGIYILYKENKIGRHNRHW